MLDIEAQILALQRWGADPNAAIKRMLGDEELFFSLLHGFAESDDWDTLQELIKQGRCREAFVISHRMKGSAADLELKPLFDCLCIVTDDLREDARENIQVNIKELIEIRDSLKKVLEKS